MLWRLKTMKRPLKEYTPALNKWKNPLLTASAHGVNFCVPSRYWACLRPLPTAWQERYLERMCCLILFHPPMPPRKKAAF